MIHKKKTGTVAIIYGLAEGQVIGKKLREAITHAGLLVTSDLSTADYIIAHSGGVFLIPTKIKAKCVILDAPSLGDRESWLGTQAQKGIIDYRFYRDNGMLFDWFYKSFWNCVYLIIHVPYHMKMFRAYQKLNKQLPTLQVKKVMVISHSLDPWSDSISKIEKKRHPNYTFLKRNSIHDDLWIEAEFYIDLL